jgi:hypothetical protein
MKSNIKNIKHAYYIDNEISACTRGVYLKCSGSFTGNISQVISYYCPVSVTTTIIELVSSSRELRSSTIKPADITDISIISDINTNVNSVHKRKKPNRKNSITANKFPRVSSNKEEGKNSA